MIEILPLLTGGLVLFLYAIAQLSQVLGDIFTDKARYAIEKYTRNIFVSVLIGTILTILLDSSSAVIILTITFINARSLSFKNAMGIIMGANIGTTFSSQIIALDVEKFAIIPLLVGLILKVFIAHPNAKKYGSILLYFGMLFFGLFIMEEAVLPLKDSATFKGWITRIEDHHVQGAFIGGLVTLIIQSSSATMGMAIVLAKQNLINTAGGVAVMLGAELGTCSSTLLATIKGSRQALKAGLFHLFFNLITIAIGLVVFHPFVELILFISSNQSIDNQIANAHMLFNIGGVLIFLPFTGLAHKALNYVLPDKKETSTATIGKN